LAAPNSVANIGATVRPIYGVRQPMMYHLFESEMKSVSTFNSVALVCFSVASFLLNSMIAIVIGWGFSSQPVSEFGSFMIRKGIYFIGVLALILLAAGAWMVLSKRSIIEQIKRETKSAPQDQAVTSPPGTQI
jgi:hypothetical protein